jgi:hypothetical protein
MPVVSESADPRTRRIMDPRWTLSSRTADRHPPGDAVFPPLTTTDTRDKTTGTTAAVAAMRRIVLQVRFGRTRSIDLGRSTFRAKTPLRSPTENKPLKQADGDNRHAAVAVFGHHCPFLNSRDAANPTAVSILDGPARDPCCRFSIS